MLMTFIYRSFINIAIPLCLALLLAQTASAQTVFQGSTWSEFPGGAKAVCADDDIDNDNDGLIELCYLEDVNAIRYNLQGNTYKDSMDATGVTTGCRLVEGNEKCEGYELVHDLDFDDDDSYSSATNIVKWTTGEGWQPIGDYTDGENNNPFTSIFEGNGHAISNLTINRSDTNNVGLFGFTGDSSKISNIGMLNVDIDGKDNTGSLMGRNTGSIANIYATGSVDGVDNVGGLVGANLSGSIANSYATVSVTGNADGNAEAIGGLIGINNSGSIVNSYAAGSVDGRSDVGGLIGDDFFGSIANSYAAGSVDGRSNVGGLIGDNFFGRSNITKSYWDTSTTRVSTSGSDEGKTTVALQEPTGATGIYSSWSTDNWDFGTPDQYPALKHGGDNSACRTSSDLRPSQKPVCRTLLRGQERNYQPRIIYPKNNDEIRISKSEADMTKTISVTVFDDNTDDELTLFLSAVAGKNLVVLETTKTTVMTNDKFKRDINEDLSIKAPQEVISGVTTLQLVAVDNSGSGNAMSEPILLQVLVGNIQPKIMPIDDIELRKGASTTLTVIVEDADGDLIDVSLDTDDSEVAEVVKATDDAGRTFQITALNKGMAKITVTANDGEKEANSITTATFTVKVLLNEAPEIVTVPDSVTVKTGEEVTFEVTASDADVDDVLTLELTTVDPKQDFVKLVTKTVEVGEGGIGQLKIEGLREGATTLHVVVGDGVAESRPASVKVTVEANAVPEVTAPASVTVKEGREETFNVTVSDADVDDGKRLNLISSVGRPDVIILTAVEQSPLMDDTKAGYVLTFKVKGLKQGNVSVSIVVSDGVAESRPASVNVTVEPNEAPAITITPEPSDIRLLEGTSATFNVTATDADSDGTDIRVQVMSTPSTIATAELVAAEGSGYSLIIEAIEAGTAEIKVSANDLNSETTTTFTVIVLANQAPVVIQNVTTQVVTIGETLSLKTSEFFNDPDGDELIYTATGLPDNDRFIFSTMTTVLEVTPQDSDVSTDKEDGVSVTVTASDGRGGSTDAVFTFLINAKPRGTVSISFASWQLTATTSTVTDANGIDEKKTSYQWYKDEEAIKENGTEPTYPIPVIGRAGGTRYKVDVTFVDNIGQEVTTSSGVYTVENLVPTLDPISHNPVKEGEDISITAMARDENDDELNYEWSMSSDGDTRSILTETAEPEIRFKVPTNWIIDTDVLDKKVTLQLEIKVTEKEGEGLSTTRTASVVVTKDDNGDAIIPSISVNPDNPNEFTFRQIVLSQDKDGVNDSPNLKYRWQHCPANTNCSSNWQDIGSLITDTTNALSLDLSGFGVGDSFRVKITYTDGQGYNENLLSGTKVYTTDPTVKVRVKVFLEGPLQ